ncbi:CRISPR-associated protein Cas4 [Thermofilum sp.]|uniref:CRISPR-associated exonuclease Cas4 n=1 Tax=Thermofilum pendens TaxID=2269 RepID=A0A7C4D4E7_THEPE
MAEEGYITVTDVKHYAYCEAIVYIERFLGLGEQATEYMEYGREIEKEKNLGFIAAKLKASFIIKKPLLCSRELKLCGSPDYVIISKHGELIPVEVKWAEPGRHGAAKRDHALQMAAYALLLERTYPGERYSVKTGYIYYLRPQGRLVRVNIDYSLKLEVLKALERIREIAEGRREPKPSLGKCSSCNFLRACPYSSLKEERPAK